MGSEPSIPYVLLADCRDGFLYRLRSRNLAFGVFWAEADGFIGIREKFGNRYLDVEYHHDTGVPFGTAIPVQELEACPLRPLQTDNQELFAWMLAKEEQYRHLLE